MPNASARDSRTLSARHSFPKLNSRISICKMKSNVSFFDAIAYINIIYSIFQAVSVSPIVYNECELQHTNCCLFYDKKLNISVEYIMWKSIYIVNVFVNVLVAIRSFVYGDRYPLLIWFAYTVPLFVLRVICTPYDWIDGLSILISCLIDGN